MSPKSLSSTILTNRNMLLSHLFMDSKRLHAVIIPILLLWSVPLACSFPPNRTTIAHSHNQQCQLHTTQKWIHKECKHEKSIVKQKEDGLFDVNPIHEFKWGTGQMIHGEFIFPNLSITPWTTNPLNIHISICPYSPMTVPSDNVTIHANQKEWMKRQVSFMRMPSE